jgi:uncharacterized membrane protein YphA (DoxX/SURF4 family)
LRWIERAVAWFWGRVGLSADGDQRSLAILRMLVGPYFLLHATPFSAWVAGAPPAFFNPPILSPVSLATGFPAHWLALGLDALQVVLTALVALGVRARISSLLLCTVALTNNAFCYSFGKIDHDILSWVAVACLAFTGAGQKLALVPDPPSRFDAPRRALSLLAVLLAFGMFSAGFGKAKNWVDFDFATSGFLSWFYGGYFDYGRTRLLAPVVVGLPPELFELADYTAVVFELGCLPALLLGPRVFRGWLLAACSFHLINTCVLNIAFDTNVLCYLAFVSLSRVEQWARGLWLGLPRLLHRALVLSIVASAAVHLVQRIGGGGSRYYLIQDPLLADQVNLISSVVLWLAVGALMLSELRTRGIWCASAPQRAYSIGRAR